MFLGLLAAGYAVAYLDRLIMAVVAEQVKSEFGLSDAQLFFLTGAAFTLIYGICGVFSGWLLDRGNRARIIAWAMAGWSLCTLVCGMANNFAALALARAGVGVGESAIVPAAMATISDRYPENRRPFAMGVFYAGGMVGILIAWTLGGWVAQTWGWRAAFLMAGPPGLILAALIALQRGDPQTAAPVRSAGPAGPSPLASVLSNRPLVWLILAGSLVTFVNVGLVTQLGSFFIRSHGLTIGQVGLIFGPIMAGGMALGLLVGGWLGNRMAAHGAPRLILFSAAVTAAMLPLYLVTILATQVEIALGAMFLANFCSVLYSPAFSSAYQAVCDPQARGTAAGVSGCANAVIGSALVTWLVGMLSDHWQPRFGADSLRYAIVAGLSVCAVSAIMFLHARRLVIAARR